MIRINLCPVDELENPYWYLPELIVGFLIGASAYFGVQYWIDTVREEIDNLKAETASLQQSIQELAPELKRFENLNKDIEGLNRKLAALRDITVSKISRYRPVIVLEHLQNVKPEGVWFRTLRLGLGDGGNIVGVAGTPTNGAANEDRFDIDGQSQDNLLTAEFLTSLRATEGQESDEADLRTMVYFGNLVLDITEIEGAGGGGAAVMVNNGAGPDLSKYPRFTIRGKFLERPTTKGAPGTPPPKPVAAAAALDDTESW